MLKDIDLLMHLPKIHCNYMKNIFLNIDIIQEILHQNSQDLIILQMITIQTKIFVASIESTTVFDVVLPPL